jgi:hypothetical protein
MVTESMVSRDTVGAGFLERLLAVIIDALVLLVPNIIVVVVLGDGIAANLVSLAIGVAYTLYIWTTSGATVGKQVMGLRVVMADGGGAGERRHRHPALHRLHHLWHTAVSRLPMGYLGPQARGLARQDRWYEGNQS